MIILSFLFLLTATLYSSVGFGGGSTYLALLLIWDIPYLIFPVIALFCNIIVVSGNCINYIKAGNINLKILTPYLISSVPLAFIGGSLSIDKEVFEILLFAVLTLAGVLLLVKFQYLFSLLLLGTILINSFCKSQQGSLYLYFEHLFVRLNA